MKRFVAFILAAMVVLSLGAGVIAEDVTSDADGIASPEVTLDFTISENVYTISMPSTVSFTSTGKTFDVSLTEAHSTKAFDCTVTSRYNWELKRSATDTDTVAYSLNKTSFQLQKNVKTTETIAINITNSIANQDAGKYYDFLTFSFKPATN